jgi:chaperone BCS1
MSSANRNLARLPIAALARTFTSLAAGLRSETSDVLNLGVDQVCLRMIAMLRSASPALERCLRTGLPFILLAFGVWSHLSKLWRLKAMAQNLHSSFLSSITVAGLNPLNKQICQYIAKQQIGQGSRALVLSDGAKASPLESKAALAFLPALKATAWFRFNGTWLRFSRTSNKDQTPEQYPDDARGRKTHAPGGGAANPDLQISCFSLTGNVQPIKDFLEHVKATSEAENASMTMIVRYSSTYGAIEPSIMHKPARKLDSVSIEAARKASMINDMTTYLASRKWYSDRGIPWRRGYLFYGPPGTGKTSISMAVASTFNLPLHIINLTGNGMNDDKLQHTFNSLPNACIVLLEDIDSAGIGRASSSAASAEATCEDDEDKYLPRGRRSKQPASVTLSGLLNAIDGPCSREGRILICTTNSPDALDPALVRPGRIDMKILFGHASAEVSESLFLHIFEDPSGKETRHDLSTMARKFAAIIPEDRFSPAEVQSYLLLHRWDPVEALGGAEKWVEGLLATKSQGGNVASFNGQI